MIKFGGYNNFYLYNFDDVGADIIVLEFCFNKNIDLHALNRALQESKKHFPLFSVRPIIDRHGKMSGVVNDEKVPIFIDDNSNKFLGTSDTNGYLYCVRVINETILSLTFSHGICDGRGALSYSNFLFSLYFHYKNKSYDCYYSNNLFKEYFDDSRNDYLYETCIKHKSLNSKLIKPQKDVFVIDKNTIYHKKNLTRLFYLKSNKNNFINIVHKYKCSVYSLIQGVIGHSILNYYNAFDYSIVNNVPIDMRKFLQSNSQSNFSLTVDFCYDKKIYAQDLVQQFSYIRNVFWSNNKPEYLLGLINKIYYPFSKKLDSVNLNSESGRLYVENSINCIMDPRSCIISNFGILNFSDYISSQINSVNCYCATPAIHPFFFVLTYKDCLSISCCFNYEADDLVNYIKDVFQKIGIECEIIDNGIVSFDALNANRFKFENKEHNR